MCSIRASLRCRQNDFNRDRCLQLIVRTGRSEFVGGLLGSFYAGEIASLARGARLQALPLSQAPYHAQRQTTNSKQRTMNDEHWWTSDDRQKNYGLRIPDDGQVATTVWQLFNTSSLLLCLLLIFFFSFSFITSTLAQGKFQMTDRWRIPFFPDDGVGTVVFYYCDLYCNSMVYKSFINSFSLSSSSVSV